MHGYAELVARARDLVAHAVPGYIARDPASASELVVPILVKGRTVGVIALESPRPGRFGDDERRALEDLAALFVASSDKR